jgi:hypothetical protein
MRTYGRIVNSSGALVWQEVDTDTAGFNDLVYLTTLCQVLQLSLNESPFYSTFGIPQVQTILQQIYPDYYVQMTQQTFAPYFASLLITKQAGTTSPTYNVAVTTHQGAKLTATVAI